MVRLRTVQIYYCTNHKCSYFKQHIESWLTPADDSPVLGGMRCVMCCEPLKWIRSEPVDPRRC